MLSMKDPNLWRGAAALSRVVISHRTAGKKQYTLGKNLSLGKPEENVAVLWSPLVGETPGRRRREQ